MIPLSHYLILSAILFSIGLYGVFTRRSAIGILLSLEIMLNAANINFAAFSKFVTPENPMGQIFVIFTIGGLGGGGSGGAGDYRGHIPQL